MAVLMSANNGQMNHRNGERGSRRVGAVNGLTNGSGMTNGNGQRRTNGRNRGTNGTNMKAGLAILVFIVLLIPPIMILLGPSEQRKIDGNLDDWAGKASIEQVPTGMDVPITKYAIDVDEKYVYFYLEVQSPRAVFESSGNQRDTVVLFLDTGQAGYRFDGINAKYKVEISGSEGNVVSTSLSEYQGDGTSWKWAPKGSIEAKASIGTLEGRIKKSDIGNAEPTVYILAQHADGKTGKSIIPFNKEMKGVALTQVGIADEIVQPDASTTLLTVNARAYGKDVELKTLTLKRAGGYNGVLNVRVVDANNAELGTASFSDGAIETTATLNRAVGTTGDLTFKVVADVSGIANNSIGLKVAGATVEGTVKVYGESKVVYVGAPTGIIIDGAFGDWAGIQGDDDPAGDVAMIPTTLPANSNIDINATKYTNDTNNVYFYAKVYGDKIMAGLTQVYRGVAGGGQSGTPTPIEEVDIYDYLYINFTVSAVGKEYSIQVVGKDGVVLSKKVLEKDIQAMVWTESTGLTASLTVACAAGELELGIPFADGQITTYTVTMSDWIGEDTTSVIFRMNGHGRTTYNTINVNGDMSDWESDELIATRNGKNLYITWDENNIYIGWTGTDWTSEGDLFIYLDTKTGGTTTSKDWYLTHTLPFEADFVFWVENGAPGNNGLDAYTTQWSGTTYSGSNFIGWSGNKNTEIAIPLSDIDATSSSQIKIMVFAQWEEAGNVWNSFPEGNPTGSGSQTFTSAYYANGLPSGVSPNTYISELDYHRMSVFYPIFVGIVALVFVVRKRKL